MTLDPALLIPVFGAGILVYLAVLPLLMLFVGSFQAEVAPREFVYTLKNYHAAYASEYTYSTFLNSLIFASGSAGLSFILGTMLAWLTERTNTPLRGIFVPLAVVPLILPGVLESIAWIFLLSPKFGYLNVWLMNLFGLQSPPFNVFSLPGMIWVHSVGQVPLAFLLMVAAFKSMDPSLEESAMMSGANTWQTFRRVTLRLLMPTAGSVMLILFVRTLESFETPALIGIPARIYVYTSEIYLAFNEYPPDYGRGGALAVGLLLLSAVGVWLYTRATKEGKKFQTVTGKAFRPRQFDLGAWRWAGFGFLSGYFLFVVLLPFLVLVLGLLPAVLRGAELGCREQAQSRQLSLPRRFSTLLGCDAEQHHPLDLDGDGGDGADFAGRVDRLQKPAAGFMDPRFSRLRADYDSRHRHGHGVDPALCRFSDSDLRHDLGFADRLCHPLYSVRHARGVGIDFTNSQRIGGGRGGLRRFLVGVVQTGYVAALAAGLGGGVDLHLHRVVSGIFHFGLAGHRRKPGALDSALHHVRAGAGDRGRGHRRVDDCYLAFDRGGIL